VPAPPNAHSFESFFKPAPRIRSESAPLPNARCAKPEVLGRGLPIGNLFILDGLPFIERRKTSFLTAEM